MGRVIRHPAQAVIRVNTRRVHDRRVVAVRVRTTGTTIGRHATTRRADRGTSSVHLDSSVRSTTSTKCSRRATQTRHRLDARRCRFPVILPAVTATKECRGSAAVRARIMRNSASRITARKADPTAAVKAAIVTAATTRGSRVRAAASVRRGARKATATATSRRDTKSMATSRQRTR